jgi:hypothetical protein
MTRRWTKHLSLLLCPFPALIFLINFVAWTAQDTWRLGEWRRYGEDMSVATTDYLEHIEPTDAQPATLSTEEAKSYMRALQRFIQKMVARHAIRPWQFWRPLRRHPLHRPGRVLHRMNDDIGRAWLAARGFRLLGGIAPFLLMWLAALLCMPVLIWVVWEFARSGHLSAGVAFAALCACSPFFVESMALPYVAFGFYLVGLLAVVATSVPLLLGASDSYVRLALRLLAAGVILALCAICRSGTLLLLPGMLLAVTFGARRIRRARGLAYQIPQKTRSKRARWHTVELFVGALILLIGPYMALRPARQHELWLGVWMGLGDFDRTKGHAWSDPVVRAFFMDAGFDRDVPSSVPIYELDVGAPEREAFFRNHVLADVCADPAWYLGILAQRLFVTVTQSKLLVFGSQRDPKTIPPPAFNEGKISFYYGRVTTADWLGLWRFRGVVPLPVLWLAGWSFLLLAAFDRRVTKLRATLKLVACVGLSAIALPVLITTAGALETEAFILVFFIAMAFLGEHVLGAALRVAVFFRRERPWHEERKGAPPPGAQGESMTRNSG